MKTQNVTIRHQFVKHMLTVGMMLFLAFMTNMLQAQTTERTVSGVVTSYDQPVPFASIVLKGTAIGVAADENGAFTFPQMLKENDILIISSLAYEDHEITITGNTTFIKPVLEANEIIIVGALRTAPASPSSDNNEN